jgi:hypothetical protein
MNSWCRIGSQPRFRNSQCARNALYQGNRLGVGLCGASTRYTVSLRKFRRHSSRVDFQSPNSSFAFTGSMSCSRCLILAMFGANVNPYTAGVDFF